MRANGEQLKDGLDEWQAAVRYKNGPIFLGGAYFEDESNNTDQFALSGGLSYGGWAASAAYEDGDNISNGVDVQSFIVAGSYSFGNNILRAHYAFSDPDDFEETDFWAVGFQHNLSKRTRVWLEYFGQNSDTKEVDDFVNAIENRDKDVVSIGVRHDF